VEAPLGTLNTGGVVLTSSNDGAPACISVVVPVLNANRFLPLTLPSVLEAAANTVGVELIYVDNGSTDGSDKYLGSIANKGIQVQRLPKSSIAAVRNFGARCARGQFLSFLDADCSVSPHYFDAALDVVRSTGAAATGCEVEAPPDPHWIEAAWHNLHYVGRDREVRYLNSANFFVSRQAFENVGGFREDLRTGEDAELGQRLISAGYRIREASAVGAIHLGNPKSIREFYRRNVWHGLGMLATVNHHRIDKPTTMMILQFFATLSGLVVLFGGPLSLPSRGLIALVLQLVVPSITVAHRARQTGRTSRLSAGVALYWLYYWARLHAFFLVVAGRSGGYQK
jgi:glycosyltransferase involved in cell wall biosynthesis